MESQYEINDFGFDGTAQHVVDVLETREAKPSQKPSFGVPKKSFLVFNRNKYHVVSTESIAFFYVKFESTVIATFNKQEFTVNYSLDQIQELLSGEQFYRLNRQYLVNFSAVKEVEHYFARKLLVSLIIPFNGKLLVSKEKAR